MIARPAIEGIRLDLLSSLQAPRWGGMTFPRYRPLLQGAGIDVVALAASVEEKPVGLALARLGRAELLSLYVVPEQRKRGIGLALMANMESRLAECGVGSVSTVWMSGTPGAAAFPSLLRRREWTPPELRMVIYRTSFARLAEATWIHAFARLPEGCAIQPWATLNSQQGTILRQAIRFEGWIPPDLDPFSFAGTGIDGAPPEPRLNLACTLWGEVVGWSFAHRIDPQTARISCTFVRPDLQAQLLMLALWREVAMRTGETEYRTVSWAVASARKPMVDFNDRHMGPYVRDRKETWGSSKVLTLMVPSATRRR